MLYIGVPSFRQLLRSGRYSRPRLATSRSRSLCVAIFTACLLCGCKPGGAPTSHVSTEQESGEIVARVGTVVLTRTELETERARRGPTVGAQQIVEDWVRFQATLAKARAEGFDQSPELRARWERFLVDCYREAVLTEQRQLAAGVTEDELREHYRECADELAIPEAVRVSVLFVRSSRQATPEKRQESADEMARLRQQAAELDALGFRELVRQRSDDQATRYRGGDVGWLARGATNLHWDASVVKAALSLRKPGELSSVIETEDGFHLIRLEEHRPPSFHPFESVRDRLRYELTQRRSAEQQAEFTRAMRSNLDIRVNQPLIDSLTPIRVRADRSIPPLPGG